MNEPRLKTATLDEIREMDRKGQLHVDADAPGKTLGAEFWRDAEISYPPHKMPVSLRLDTEVLDWFKAQGPGYQTRMNAVLRSYMESMSHKAG